MEEVKLFTAPGCPDCAEIKRRLNAAGIAYKEFDVSTAEGLAEHAYSGKGFMKSPLLVVGDRAIPNLLDQLNWLYCRRDKENA